MPITLGARDTYSPSGFLSQYASLSRLAKRRYDPAENWSFTSAGRVGTISRGPSATHLYDLTFDRDAYTVIAPPKSLTAPVFGGGRNRTGNFTLDMIDWQRDLSQLSGSTLGKDATAGGTTWGPAGPNMPPIDPQRDFLAARDIDPFVNGPRRLMDYAFAPVSVLFSAATGAREIAGLPLFGGNAAQHTFPFQANADYWNWLTQSTVEERKQQARIMADSRADRARNEPLYAMLAAQFETDYGMFDARSSGNVRADYLAKHIVQTNPLIDYYLHPERHPNSKYANTRPGEGLFDPKVWEQIAAYTSQTTDPYGGGGGNLRLGPISTSLPLVGTQLGQMLEPITPETEKKWLAMTPEERSELFGAVGIHMMASDFSIGWFGLTAVGRAAAFLGSAQRVEAGAAALGGRMGLSPLAVNAFGRGATIGAAEVGAAVARTTHGVTWGVGVVNRTMATGLAVMTASWGIQSFAPMETEWGEALGNYARAVDLARPISNSSLAGVLNEAGFFAGFYGIDYLAPRMLRTGGGALSRVPGLGGTPDLAFHQAYGGSELARIFDGIGITTEQQAAAMSAEFVSGLLNSRRAALADVREAIESGQSTGIQWIDNLPIERRGGAWEAVMAKADRDIIAGIDAQVQLVNNRVNDPLSKKIARSMDDTVTAHMLRRYGSISRYWGPQVADMRAATTKFIGGLGLKSSAIRQIERWAGKNTDRWGQATRRSFQMLFHKRHGEMVASATRAGEDPSRFAVFSLRTLFADEVPDMVRRLTDPDPAVGIAEMRRLVDDKDDVLMLHDRGQFSTPEELAELLDQAQPLLPARRIVTPDGDELDAFQTMLDGEGLWTIGYKPVGRFTGEIPEAWVHLDEIAESVPDAARVMVTIEQLEAMGYRRPFVSEIMPGTEFRKRNPVWPIHEYGGGVWIKRFPDDDVREAQAASNTQPAFQSSTHRRGRGLPHNILTDDTRHGFEVPDQYDLEHVIVEGSQHMDWRPGISQAFHGRSSMVFKPGEGAVLPDEWLGYHTSRNLDDAPLRSVDEMQEAWEAAYLWEATPDPAINKAGTVVYEISPNGTYGFWLIKPKANPDGTPWLGYDLTWPKGGVGNKPAPMPDLSPAADGKRRLVRDDQSRLWIAGPRPRADGTWDLTAVRVPWKDVDEGVVTVHGATSDITETIEFRGPDRMARADAELADQVAYYEELIARESVDIPSSEVGPGTYTDLKGVVQHDGPTVYRPSATASAVPESLKAAAARELREETGFDADLRAWLGDVDGVRYYLAARKSGGPDFLTSGKEVEHLELVNPADVVSRLTRDRDKVVFEQAMTKLPLQELTGGDFQYMHGRNGGADWPILRDYIGRKYLFKAQQTGGGPPKSMTPATRLAGITATKFFVHAGLGTAPEAAFVWDGLQGTIQPLIDVSEKIKLDSASLKFYDDMHKHGGPDVIGELQRQQVADWFTSQHDSNSDAFLMGEDGVLNGIDKGQAWKFFESSHEAAAYNNARAFWTYGVNDPNFPNPENIGGDVHLGQYLWDYHHAGGFLDRGAVEETLRKIESITDNEMHEWLDEFANARELQGRNPGGAAFVDAMIARRDTLRDRVNAAYNEIGQIGIARNGRVNYFKAGQNGTMSIDGGPVKLNSRLVPLHVAPGVYDSLPPLPDKPTYIGVIVEESDGRIWTTEYSDGSRSIATSVDAVSTNDSVSEQMMMALGVTENTYGLSIRIDEFVADIPSWDGSSYTRWLLATRTGGGPGYALSGNTKIALGTYEQLRVDPRTAVVMTGSDAMDALFTKRNPPMDPNDALPVEPGHAVPDDQPHNEYVSYTVLPSGMVYRSPWIDYPIPHAEDVVMGNRAILSARLDAAFTGWRTTRILEIQKGTLYRRLDSISPSFTASRVQEFHDQLLEMAREYNYPGIQPLGLSRAWPDVLPGIRQQNEAVNDLADRIFGKGPFLGRDGKIVSVDWQREIANAYVTALKLNLTAGVTSHLKATGIGQRMAVISDVFYPAFRFGLSPFFKAGEWAEAPILGAMRGTNPFGMDDVARSVWQRAGLPHAGADLGLEMMTDPMMSNIGGQPRIEASRRGWLSAAPPEGYAAQVAEQRHPDLAIRTAGEQDQAPTGLMENIFPRPQVREFPDLPTHDAELLIPHKQDPQTGEYIGDPARMRELDAERLAYSRRLHTQSLLRDVGDPVTGPQALDDLSTGMGWLDHVLPPEQSRRLALNAPIIHSIGKSESRDMRRIQHWLEEGLDPLTSPAGHGAFSFQSKTTGSGEQVLTTGGLRASTAEGEETLLAMADAPYAGHGVWMDGVKIVVRNDRMLPRAVITDGDRMNFYSQGGLALVNEHMLSANGAVDLIEGAIRTNVIRMGRWRGSPSTLVDQVQSNFGPMHPLEYAWPNGGTWEDIDALVFTDAAHLRQWNDLVAQYGDSVPGIKDIEPILIGAPGSLAGYDIMGHLWRRAFVKAGLADKMDLRFEQSLLDEGLVHKIVPNEAILPQNVDELEMTLRYQLDAYGGNAQPDRRWSLEDILRAFMRNTKKGGYSAEERVARATGDISVYGGPAAAKAAWERELQSAQGRRVSAQREVREAQELLDEMLEWRARTTISDYDTAQRIIDDPASLSHDVLNAEQWQNDWETFAARFRQLDPNYRPFDRHRLSTGQFSEAVLPENQFIPEERVHIPAGDDADIRSGNGFGGQRFSDAGEIEIVKAMNARLGMLRQYGIPLGRPGFMSQDIIARTITNVAPSEFGVELKRLAELKTGQYQSYPTVKVWMRGDESGITSGRGSAEIIVTVSYPDGTNPLTLAEIADVWQRYGAPARQTNFDGGRQPVAQELLKEQGFLWSPVGGPNGSLVIKTGPGMIIDSQVGTTLRQGDMVQDGNGLWGFLPAAGVSLDSTPRPVRFLYSFESGGHKALWNLDDDMRLMRSEVEYTMDRASVPGQTNYSPRRLTGTQFRYVAASNSDVKWAYGYTTHSDYIEVWPQDGLTAHFTEVAIRDMIAEFPPDKPVSLTVEQEQIPTLARMHSTGELPPDWILKNRNTSDMITDADLEAMIPLRRAEVVPPPDSLAEVPGSPEAMMADMDRSIQADIRSAVGAEKERLQRGWTAFWNPVPYKQRQQDRLMRDLADQYFPTILERQNQKAFDLYTKTLGVPKDEIVGYLLEDRLLYDRWLATNSRDDFEALINHADKYGIAKGDTRADLDSLYESPDWATTMEMLRWTAKAAQEEAFGVHFFTMHRSTFERSINHPLLGVYPASWSYKVAKEWFRFLYLNQTFGFRLGMQPAHAIATTSQAQQQAVAMNEGTDLNPWLEDGPFSSSLFLFNLLMPGDWSALPFPLSRSLRDMIRPPHNLNPADHFRNNMFSMGLGRDIRLVDESAEELFNAATGKTKPRMQRERLAEEVFRR